MGTSVDEIYNKALSLTEEERWELIKKLLGVAFTPESRIYYIDDDWVSIDGVRLPVRH